MVVVSVRLCYLSVLDCMQAADLRSDPVCTTAQRQLIDPTLEAPGLLTADLDGYVSTATRQDFINRRALTSVHWLHQLACHILMVMWSIAYADSIAQSHSVSPSRMMSKRVTQVERWSAAVWRGRH